MRTICSNVTVAKKILGIIISVLATKTRDIKAQPTAAEKNSRHFDEEVDLCDN